MSFASMTHWMKSKIYRFILQLHTNDYRKQKCDMTITTKDVLSQNFVIMEWNPRYILAYTCICILFYYSVKPFTQPPFALCNPGMEKPVSSPSAVGGLIQTTNGSSHIGSNVLQTANPNNGHAGNNSVSNIILRS